MEVTKHGVTLRAASHFLWVPWAGQGVGTSPLSMQTEETLSSSCEPQTGAAQWSVWDKPFLLHKELICAQQRLQEYQRYRF